MKNKIIIVGLLILILIMCSTSVYANENLNNMTLTALDTEIDLTTEYASEVVSTPTEITITDDNYDIYFNKYTGKLKKDVDKNINTIKIGNVSNKAFILDRPLNLMPVSQDCEISNGVIHLISGSDGSNITGLTINNTKGELYQEGLFVSKLHGIWFSNSSDNLISNNTIRIPASEGCYAIPMGYSNRNKIIYNDVVTTFTCCMLLGSCHYNNISYNSLKIKRIADSVIVANVIYFSKFGHADYRGPADSIGNYITNNYLENANNDIMAFTLNILGECNDTRIINNTIVNGYHGIKVYDEWGDNPPQSKNVIIEGNTIINASYSISTADCNVFVSNNKIMGSSMNVAISIIDTIYKDNVSVFGNDIIFDDLYTGISTSAMTRIFDNNIRLSRYGVGITVLGSGSIVNNNNIHVNGDNGIVFFGNNISIMNNIVHTKFHGIFSQITLEFGIKDNRIECNKIYSDGYAVYIEGYIYNTTINNNQIETNKSNTFLIDVYPTLENSNPGKIFENTVNGVIKNTEILIINDTNFYDYFDENGYLKYEFKSDSQKILFLTFLSNKNMYFTDSIILTSNKQANLLYNVTITLKEDASDSIIKDFKFYNFNREAIILEGVESVVIKDNEFTILASDVFDMKTIHVIGGCNLCNITDNTIFINSEAYYTYAILVSEPSYSLKKKFSRNFTISNNNILIKSSGVAEAMYFDALTESNITNNNINIISDGSAYGISVCDIMGRPSKINIDSNKIIVNSNEMSYLIELYKVDDSNIKNNYIKGKANGIYALGIFDSTSKIFGNEVIVVGKNLTNSYAADALGKGNSAIYITKKSEISELKNNVFDSQNCEIISVFDSNIEKMYNNSFVISNDNYGLYFDINGKLFDNIIHNGDRIIFKNFTNDKIMNIDVHVDIIPYSHLNNFKATLILSSGSNNSNIHGFEFNNSNIILNGVSGILINLNNFTESNIRDNFGINNSVHENLFKFNENNEPVVIFNNCLNCTFNFNELIANSSPGFILIVNSNQTMLCNNSFEGHGNSIKLICSNSTNSCFLMGNIIKINGTGDYYWYFAYNSTGDEIINNSISINVNGNPIAIYYGNSSQNVIKFNRIISNSNNGQDYAIVIDSDNNSVTNNYLISSNGFKKGNSAVNATNNIVHDNLPVEIYVSTNGSEEGNGTFENPYPTIKKAIESCLSGSIIYIFPGMYDESNIEINKNITLTAINLGTTYINALNNQLFRIGKNGTLSINALRIFNGFTCNGGSLFQNYGNLFINNSIIFNSSSYYNNSNPTFNVINKYDPCLYSYDCSNCGVGGAILNYGELTIYSSILCDNFAHKGGAIADFGKTTINNSLIRNNIGVHGGAIYTDSKNEFIIENSVFKDNLAIQTLDYCFIQRSEVNYHLEVIRYHYLSKCGVLPGLGGAIFSNTKLSIDNSSFEHNLAKIGGGIAYDSNLLTNQNYYHDQLDYSGRGSQIKYSPTAILNINNSVFKGNKAINTSSGNLSMLVDTIYGGKLYNIHFDGGAIFGALTQFNVYNTTFSYNEADSDGGALCVQSLNSSIELTTFHENTAGGSGGALDIFGDFEVFNTEFANNSAKYGGAVQYSSYSEYSRIQKNVDMFNVTIAGNKALTSGGAFLLNGVNLAIKNSNIFDNFAPEGSTISGRYGISTYSNIEARGNWWGTLDGPDDSVFMQHNIKFRSWVGQHVDWKSVLLRGNSKTDDKDNFGNPNSNSHTSSSISTGSGVHTGSSLSIDTFSSENTGNGFKFNGKWPRGNGKGNGGLKEWGDGVNPFDSNGNSNTNVKGNVLNHNSLSKTNSSKTNNLDSVGMISNAADAATSSQSSSNGGDKGDSVNVYEITKQIKDLSELDEDSPIYFILYLIICSMFFIGFYRKYKSTN